MGLKWNFQRGGGVRAKKTFRWRARGMDISAMTQWPYNSSIGEMLPVTMILQHNKFTESVVYYLLINIHAHS